MWIRCDCTWHLARHVVASGQVNVDAVRVGQLQQMKRRATGLLLIAAFIFFVTFAANGADGWVGYVRAASEAALVGGLADWFAVTALFRHPLGLPIPHTSIIPTRKDQIGESLGAFVQENFLTREVVADKLSQANVSQRASAWLAVPEHAADVARQGTAAIGGIIEVLRDDDVRDAVDQVVVSRLKALPIAPMAGRVLDVVTSAGRHHELFEAALNGLSQTLEERREFLRGRFAVESPWWVPEPIDDRVFDRIFNGVQAFVAEVASDPNHELRRHVDERLTALVAELQTSDELLARGEEFKAEILAHPAVRDWSASLWDDLKSSILRQADDPASPLRHRIESAIISVAESVHADPQLQAKVDAWIQGAVGYLVEQYRHEVSDLIAGTVRTWDPNETSERIETQIGRDLQFIRINGTLVGAIVGLLLHTLTTLL